MTGAPAGGGATPLTAGMATASVIGGAIGFSSISIATVIATRDATPLTTIILARFLLGALLILAISGWRALRLERRHAWRLVWLGGAGQVIVNLLNLSALDYIPAATTVFLFYTFPAWVAVVAAVRGTERVGARRLVALVLSLAGIVVIIGAPGAEEISPIGAALSLSAAFFYALYVPLLRRLQQGTTPTVTVFYIAIGVCVMLAFYGALRHELVLPASRPTLGAIGWLALVPTVVAFRLFLAGLASLGAVRTAIISTVEPFSAAVLGALLLDQPITLPMLAGGALIAAAVLMLQRPDRRASA